MITPEEGDSHTRPVEACWKQAVSVASQSAAGPARMSVCTGSQALTLATPCTHSKHWGCPLWLSEGVILRHPARGSAITLLGRPQHTWCIVGSGQNGVIVWFLTY